MLLLNCESCIWFGKVGQNCRTFPTHSPHPRQTSKTIRHTQVTTDMIYCFKAQDRGLSAFLRQLRLFFPVPAVQLCKNNKFLHKHWLKSYSPRKCYIKRKVFRKKQSVKQTAGQVLSSYCLNLVLKNQPCSIVVWSTGDEK